MVFFEKKRFKLNLHKALINLLFMKIRKLKENLNTSNMLEYELLKNHLERFDYLRFLMKTTKFLGCEALYQFVAASIASWFRRRSIRDVAHDL